MNKTELRQAVFIQRIVQANDTKPWLDVINEEKEKIKGYCTDQSNSNLGNKTNYTIALNEDADNGEVYDKSTGITSRDLI